MSLTSGSNNIVGRPLFATTNYGSVPTTTNTENNVVQQTANVIDAISTTGGGSGSAVPTDKVFDPNDAYYLQDQRNWTVRRVLSLVVPLLVSFFIVGGAVWYLLSDFNTLYPGHNGGNAGRQPLSSYSVSTPNKVDTGGVTSTDSTVPHSINTDQQTNKTQEGEESPTIHSSKTYIGSSECSKHLKCAGLIGECCPTTEGLLLDCCN